eukprot:203603_1
MSEKTKKFIEKSNLVHNNFYDYSKVNYTNNTTKVKIKCPNHGEFMQRPKQHLRGEGCKECGYIKRANKNKYSQNEFVEKANLVHNNLYDYSKTSYKHSETKITIICPAHGEYEQTPKAHLNGQGCFECGLHKRGNSRRKSCTEFIQEANKFHNNLYDYSKVKYKNNRTKVIIICPEHSEFEQAPHLHLIGNGCPKCAGRILDPGDFRKKANKIHHQLYDYSKVNYVNNKTKVTIICKKHGEFEQTPSDHICKKHGCPICRASKGELRVLNHLRTKGVKFKHQKYEEFLLKTIIYDFYIYDNELYLEYDGNIHFMDSIWTTYEMQHKKDLFKDEFIRKNNKKLLRIHYKDYENIEQILDKYLNTKLENKIYHSRKQYYEDRKEIDVAMTIPNLQIPKNNQNIPFNNLNNNYHSNLSNIPINNNNTRKRIKYRKKHKKKHKNKLLSNVIIKTENPQNEEMFLDNNDNGDNVSSEYKDDLSDLTRKKRTFSEFDSTKSRFRIIKSHDGSRMLSCSQCTFYNALNALKCGMCESAFFV